MPCSPLKSTDVSEENIVSIFSVEEEAKQKTFVKAGGKRINWIAEISAHILNRREMKDSKSDPIGLPVGHREPLLALRRNRANQ
jgi:hypothetical protein